MTRAPARRALSTRVFGAVPPVDGLVERLEALDTRGVYLHEPVERPGPFARRLRAAGVTVAGVGAGDAPPAAAQAAIATASRLRASALVFDGGVRRADAAPAARVEALARDLHALLRRQVPAAVLPADVGPQLLDEEALTWILDDLPGLGLWLDPARVLRRERSEGAPGLLPLLDRYAGRCVGTFVSGLGSDGRGGRHPEDDGPPWSTLSELLPSGIPWVLDLDADAEADELEDAMRYLRHLAAA